MKLKQKYLFIFDNMWGHQIYWTVILAISRFMFHNVCLTQWIYAPVVTLKFKLIFNIWDAAICFVLSWCLRSQTADLLVIIILLYYNKNLNDQYKLEHFLPKTNYRIT